MAKLSLYLPPFAGDYSGACSTLFGLDCLIILIDAGCCTRNYVEYDETRWKNNRKSTFSAQLRTLDAVLGDDTRIVDQTIEAAEALNPECIALIGTPVPAIVGMDLTGIAHEIECRCGVPTFGIATTGFETYEQGASLALETLCRRFADNTPGPTKDDTEHPPLSVNVLGATPHDFMGEKHLGAFGEILGEQGFNIALNTAGSYTLSDVSRAAHADASLVVAWSGLTTARLLKERFGIPILVGFPPGCTDIDLFIDTLRAQCQTKVPLEGTLKDTSKDTAARSSVPPILIVGDHVAAHTMRSTMRRRFANLSTQPPIDVASFFSMERSLMEPDDTFLTSEADLVRYAERHPGFQCIGDPLLRRIPGFENIVMLELPHEAVSSTLFEGSAPLPGLEMDQQIDLFIKRCLDSKP